MTLGSRQLPNLGKSHDWITPRFILKALGSFDLDPCACDPQPWPTAKEQWTEDGFGRRWSGRVWLNPPYGNQTSRWLAKLADYRRGGTALVFARTETRFFHQWIWPKATAILFLAGRLTFYRPDGSVPQHNCGGPSCLVAYSHYDAFMLKESGLNGAHVQLKR